MNNLKMETNHASSSGKISRFTLLFCILWIFFCMIAFSNAGSNVLLSVLALYIVGGWGISWLIRLFVAWRRKAKHLESKLHRVYWRYWSLEPVAIIIPLVLAVSGVFSSIRFALSEPALSRYVADVRAGKVDLAFEFSHPSRQVGLYCVTFTDLLPDGTVRMITSSHGLMDKAGFANSPQQSLPKQAENSYQHIRQHWWYWYESW
jgi:hypothetical protein